MSAVEQPEIIDGDEPLLAPGQTIAVRQVGLVPTTTAAELVQRLDVIRGAMDQAMQKDVDYGVIPGTGKKPTLLKPGAEKLAVLFQLDVQLANEKLWGDDGHLTVVSRATVFHAPTGTRVASGEGICSTREGKYAFRQSERFCPSCGVAAIIKGKAEYGGGFVCFKKKGGCGAKYGDGDPAITDQPTGQVANPNIADTYNTVDKMASKRARVDAVLAATGASALFTQDVEDAAPSEPEVGGQGAVSESAESRKLTGPLSGSPGAAATSPAEDDGLFPPGPAAELELLEARAVSLAAQCGETAAFDRWLGAERGGAAFADGLLGAITTFEKLLAEKAAAGEGEGGYASKVPASAKAKS